jgi:hypothetical protein
MKYVDLQKVYVPSEWEEMVTEMVAELAAMPGKERAQCLDKQSYAVWRLMKTVLERASGGKCFYLDAEMFGGEGEVDHFRPKRSVQACDLAKDKTHDGYWWLAFTVNNFRYSSQVSNRLSKDEETGVTVGKGTRFPLLDPEKRATTAAELPQEEPLLLDPSKAEDVKLLGFNDAGEAEPSFDAKDDAARKKVNVSIECFNINNEKIKKRRGHRCLKAKELAQKLARLEKQRPWDRKARKKVIETKIEIYEMLQPQSNFSSAVRYILRPFEVYPSVKEVLDRANQ